MFSNIIYRSELNTDLIKPNQLISTLETIITNCNKKNARIKVSGILIFFKNYFYQWFEGDKESVDQLFDQIVKDNRHRRLTVMKTNFQDFRMFEKHPMKFVSTEVVCSLLNVNANIFEQRADSEFEEISRNPSEIIHAFSKFK